MKIPIIGGSSCAAIRLSNTAGALTLLFRKPLPSRKIMNGVGFAASYCAGT